MITAFGFFIAGLVLGSTLGYQRGIDRRPYTRLDVVSLEEYRSRHARHARRDRTPERKSP